MQLVRITVEHPVEGMRSSVRPFRSLEEAKTIVPKLVALANCIHGSMGEVISIEAVPDGTEEASFRAEDQPRSTSTP